MRSNATIRSSAAANAQSNSNAFQTERKRGSKKIEYSPPEFREIEGIHLVNTPRQLVKLAIYLSTDPAKRPPYEKLGATVILKQSQYWIPPFSIWAVYCEGRVRIVRIIQDPRGAARQMASLRQPWNMERAIAAYAKPKYQDGAVARCN